MLHIMGYALIETVPTEKNPDGTWWLQYGDDKGDTYVVCYLDDDGESRMMEHPALINGAAQSNGCTTLIGGDKVTIYGGLPLPPKSEADLELDKLMALLDMVMGGPIPEEYKEKPQHQKNDRGYLDYNVN